MSALVLFSGGMDSTVALYHTLLQCKNYDLTGPVHSITFQYGQTHSREVYSSRTIWTMTSAKYRNEVGEHIRAYIPPDLIPRTGALLEGGVKHYKKMPDEVESQSDPAFLPHRNLMFLTIAAMWARALDAQTIVTGLRGGFADCTPNFERQVSFLLNYSDPTWPITVQSPVHASRSDTVRLAQSIPGCMNAIAFSLTCFEGNDRPCGTCLPCLKRAEGFAQVGIKDPLITRVGHI